MSLLIGATVFFNHPDEFAGAAEVAARYPFLRYVEFRGEPPFIYPGITRPDVLRRYRGIVEKAGLRSTFHSSMYDINLATLNPRIKEANICWGRDSIDAAAQLGSEVIVVHCGEIYREFAGSPLRESFLETARNHLTETLWELCEYAGSRGVKIALENSLAEQGEALITDAATHIELLNRVNHPNLGALLDFAHAFLNQLDPVEYLEAIRPHLLEIHAHNNHGAEDEHLGLHCGNIDYRPLLAHPAVQGVPFIMEIKSYQQVMETLEWLCKELERS